MRSKSLWALAMIGVLAVTLTAVYAAPQEMTIEVRLGEKGDKGDKRDDKEHNITIEALRGGQKTFWVKGKNDAMFLVDMDVAPEEVRSFAKGTALLLDATPAIKAEANDESAVDGWIVQAGADVSMIVTLQLKEQVAYEPDMTLPAPVGGGAGGW